MFDLNRIGAGLSLTRDIGRLPALLAAAQSVVVQAPPGTGKTTLVPPAVCNECGGRVIVVAPRRVAVRAAWARLRSLAPERAAQVGFAVRGASERGELVEFVTPGVLRQRLLRDPALDGVSAVLIDEVHERSLDTDLLLAMLRELCILRDDLRLIAMSATLDATRFCDYLSAPLLATESVLHPVDTTYEPVAGRLQGSRDFYAAVGRRAVQALAESPDVLVFVPGVREIELVLEHCRGAVGAGSGFSSSTPAVFPLHGRLSLAEQDQALYTPGPRIVVSTPVAESSVTVPGVRCVIDTGLARVPRRDRARGMTGLVTESISQSSAEQRAGRAGREGPGRVIRLYSQQEYAAFRPAVLPEIFSADLTAALLAMQAWGSTDLELLDPAPPQALAEAQATLDELGNPAPEIALIPLPPRLAVALQRAGSGAAATLALLSDQATGDLSREQASSREVRRLAALAPFSSAPLTPGVVVAMAYPQWIARRVPDSPDSYLLAAGTRATLGFSLPEAPEWIACADVQRTQRGAIIRAAAPLTETEALEGLSVTENVEAQLDGTKVRGRLVKRAGAIVLSTTAVRLSPEDTRAALINAVRSGTELPFSDEAAELRARLAFLHDVLGAPWPDVSWPALQARVEEWLSEPLISAADLRAILPWPEAAALDELAPARLDVPSGNRPKVSYDTSRPVVRVKLQECFGLADSPTCAGVKVQFHLLSPAGRPLAVTDDLSSFWSGPYTQVRAEMRGRYPKHPWPENPWDAEATARTKPRA
ncbi:ATP-dependent RNA helicase [Staphylococcus chromogenes]|nr:ATP-dependent RNA helicase [Staphylococcus chromogenes]